ncbi:MAG: hypothetical protein E7523_02880 [Ruminococcaceae bacterium]|nr:hypothetical protein [Oscillospiraceae bacterium]
MKKNHISIISLLLIASLSFLTVAAFNSLSINAQAATTEGSSTNDSYTYSITNGKATIQKANSALCGEITIPEMLEGYPVTTIASYSFGECANITSITFPETVERINDSIFDQCIEIPIIDIYSTKSTYTRATSNKYLGVIIIENKNCNIYGRETTFPSNAVICGHDNSSAQEYATIHNRTFVSIDGEENDIIASGYCGDYADWSLTRSGELSITGNGAMYDYNVLSDLPWYEYRGFIKSVSITQGITSVGDNAFSWCVNLSSVAMPDSITELGNEAFRNCVSLQDITISSGVTSISNSVFNDCTELKSITILNPSCTIDDTNNTLPSNSKIIGYDNSTARSYARKYNRNFELIDCTHCDENTDGLCDLCKFEFTLQLGDIDNDNRITSSDARTALRAAVGLDALSEAQQKAADVDKDDKITSADARSILRCAVGLETFD